MTLISTDKEEEHAFKWWKIKVIFVLLNKRWDKRTEDSLVQVLNMLLCLNGLFHD